VGGKNKTLYMQTVASIMERTRHNLKLRQAPETCESLVRFL
jgi:hypothetical protein